ncbi:glutathione S-transferase theta-1a [Brienomyrus brachyistius]|uniref:glutathione S-transferase theta-1a n=1 Tax=Brienomyrus brachyistius TaxID=42636 RepID=UPI0020B1F96C|nr:glutathione S-transferase theta-1a [Brienomyrus brachyistius]
MPLELFLDLYSQPCRSVYIFAKINEIPFEFRKVDLASGEQYGEEFGKISVLRKVPVMRDGDFVLTESVAILQYMVEMFSTPDHWYPADVQKRARVNEYLSWQHTAMRSHAAKVFWFRCLVPIITGAEVPKEKMDSALEDLSSTLNMFENKFLRDQHFITGDQISLADLVAITEMMQPVGAGLDIFKDRPRLSAWRDRVKQELGVAAFHEAHEVIMNAASLPQEMESKGMLEFIKPRIEKLFN